MYLVNQPRNWIAIHQYIQAVPHFWKVHVHFHAIPVVVEADATLPESMEHLPPCQQKNMHVIVWGSTRTGGYPWQQFHMARDE